MRNPGSRANGPGVMVNLKEQADMTDRTCSVPGCERKKVARGWCQAHWGRWKRTGDPGPADIAVKVRRESTVCAVDGCGRARRQRDWCGAHYNRWLKTGDTGPAEIFDQSIPRRCAVDGCDKPYEGNGYCCAHAHRLRKYGDPLHVPQRPGVGDPRGWIKQDVGYMGAHNRVRRLKGKAADHACVTCGESARDWAYDHQDPDERTEMVGDYLVPFSMKVEHYQPMCKPCHVILDKEHSRCRSMEW